HQVDRGDRDHAPAGAAAGAADLLSAPGVGVVVVLHDLNLARRYAEEVVVLGVPDIPGGLRQGPTAEVLAPPLIEAVWRMPCQGVVGADGTVQYLFG
ncbi:hypothetical protein ACEN8K_11920, partial [Variovorax sp. CT11-76]